MYIAIDFDGTVVDHRYPDIGPEVPEAVRWMKRWQEAGARLILWTVRFNNPDEQRQPLTLATKWFEEQGIELTGVNCNPDISWHGPKVFADIYVDDRNIGCPKTRPAGFVRDCVDWRIIGPVVDHLLKFQGHLEGEPK